MIKGEPKYNKEGILKWLLIIALLFNTVAGYSGNTSSLQKQHNRIELVYVSNNKVATKAFSYKQLFHAECKQPFFYTDTKLWLLVILIHNSISNVKFNAAATQGFSIKHPRRFRQLKAIPQSSFDSVFISLKR
jgi:hypothetical protein